MGDNPNVNEWGDEYILNLQQQIHFMNLELRILKEKVIEDEKKSGIGSLYDDDKTSHQHINLLQIKYKKMRRDFDKAKQRLDDENLKVMGEAFTLQAQHKLLKDQSAEIKAKKDKFNQEYQEKRFAQDKITKDQCRATATLNNEVRDIIDSHKKASEQHLHNTMFLRKDKTNEDELERRHKEEAELDLELIKNKKEKIQELEDALKALHDEWAGNGPLQESIEKEKELRQQIEEGIVLVQKLTVEQDVLKQLTEQLQVKKDELVESKADAEKLREDLTKSAKTKDDAAHKRIMQKLEREKTDEKKKLQTEMQMLEESNADAKAKLLEEIRKHEQLLSERQTLEENFNRKTAKKEEDLAIIAD